MIELITWPFIACIALVLIHGYFGAFVLRRGIIFIDLALAQWAALGHLIGHWLGMESPVSLFFMGFGSTLIAACILVLLKPFYEKVNLQEASIGVVYILATTMATALISSTGMEGHHLNEMLAGHLLFVSPSEVMMAIGIYVGIAIILYQIHHQLLTVRSRGWDFMFYALFGLVVTSSVKMVGILLVFSFLVIPILTIMLFVKKLKDQLIGGWIIGSLGAIIGISLAIVVDIPPSLSIILVYIAIFLGGVGTKGYQQRLIKSKIEE